MKKVKAKDFANVWKFLEYDRIPGTKDTDTPQDEDFLKYEQKIKGSAEYKKIRSKYPSNIQKGYETSHYNFFIELLQFLLKKINLEDNILVEPLKDKVFIDSGGTKRFKHKITVQNIEINVGEIFLLSFLQRFHRESEQYPADLSTVTENKFSDGLFICFKKNIFKSSIKGNAWMQLSVDRGCYLELTDNIFDQVDLYVGATAFVGQHSEIFCNFKNNIFDNRHLTIGTCGGESSIAANNEIILPSDMVKKMRNIDQMKDFLKSQYPETENIELKPEYVEILKTNDKIHLVFNDNQINALNIDHFSVFLQGANQIKKLPIHPREIDIYWNEKTIIDPEGEHVYHNRDFLIELKKKFKNKEDSLQERLIQREIIKCEAQILKKEGLMSAWQNRFIMFMSRVISNYGISWIRPLIWLCFLNFSLSALAYAYMNYYGLEFKLDSLFYVLFESLNPTSNLGDTMFSKNIGKTYPTLSIINIFHKVFFGMAAYETIKIVRRFSIK